MFKFNNNGLKLYRYYLIYTILIISYDYLENRYYSIDLNTIKENEMKKVSKLLVIGSLAMSTAIYASNIHTWHTITAQNGTWNGTLSSINEESKFETADGSPIHNFTVDADHPIRYGFGFDHGADFNIAYTLTLTQQDTQRFSSKACVFVITARGPANPDIRVEEFNGAKCSWVVVPHVGEDFNIA